MTTKDLEKGPWSYDLYSDGLQPVALLNNTVRSPLDTAAERNIIPIRRPA